MSALLRQGQAAKRLGLPTTTINAWVRAGRIATVTTITGERRISAAEVERLAAEMTTPTGTEEKANGRQRLPG